MLGLNYPAPLQVIDSVGGLHVEFHFFYLRCYIVAQQWQNCCSFGNYGRWQIGSIGGYLTFAEHCLDRIEGSIAGREHKGKVFVGTSYVNTRSCELVCRKKAGVENGSRICGQCEQYVRDYISQRLFAQVHHSSAYEPLRSRRHY